MNNDKQYFHIELEHLKGESIFPFTIFIFNPMSKAYTAFLFGNSPLTEDKNDFLDFILKKGGELAIQMKQKRTFLKHMTLKEEDIPDLKEDEVHDLLVKQEENQRKLAEELKKKGTFKFNDHLKDSFQNDDFSEMIRLTRMEMMCFSATVSHTVSLAKYLAETLLVEDNFNNRIVALSYQLAKSCSMKDEEALGDLTVASFLAHLGQTQMDYILSKKCYLEMNDKQKKTFKKHPGLTHHLIKKSKIDLSDRCIKIILQHHERYDGCGYPDNTKGAYIDPMALVLGCAAHILEYSSGKITGSKVNLRVILQNMKNKTLSPGLEIEFGDTIYESLTNIFGDKAEENVAQAA